MHGEHLWRMSEEREEMERQRRLSLPGTAKALEIVFGNELERDPGLLEKLPVNLVRAINDVVACA